MKMDENIDAKRQDLMRQLETVQNAADLDAIRKYVDYVLSGVEEDPLTGEKIARGLADLDAGRSKPLDKVLSKYE